MILRFKNLRVVALAGALTAPGSGIWAQELPLDAPDPDFHVQIWAQNVESDKPFLPGATVAVGGQFFRPGQKVWFSRGIFPVTPEPLIADAEGRISALVTIPANAPVGTHPILLSTERPYHAEILDLKISPELAVTGAEMFDVQAAKLAPGLYQSAYSARAGAIFASSAAGYPPITQSEILKVDPATLEIVARTTPSAAPQGGLYAVYGLGVDDANGRVWVTNTRHDTVAVYAQSDLSLVKQFDAGLIPHARDVVVSGQTGKAYVSAVGAPGVAVFDAQSLAYEGMITIITQNSRVPFSPTSLHLDDASGKLFTPNMTEPELAIIDVTTGKTEKIIPLKGAKTAIGVSYDPETKRIFVAAQGSDNLLIVDAQSGETLKAIAIGAGPLSVAFDPVSRLAYVASRGAGTITVVDVEGEIVANLEGGPQPNHVTVDGEGEVFAVNKARQPDDPAGDNIRRIRRAP